MKTNKIYILAASILLAGLVIFGVGFTLSGFDIHKISTQSEFIEKGYISKNEVNAIAMDDSNVKIDIITSNDSQVHLTYFESDKEYYDINQSADGTLSIIKKNNRKWYDYIFNINFQSISLTLAIPSNFHGDLSAKTSNASITLTDIHAATVRLDTSNNRITANQTTVSGKFEAKTSNGGIFLSKITCNDDVICNTSNNKISLEDVAGKNIRLETSNGSVSLQSVISNESILIDTSNGSVTFHDIRFKNNLNCHNSNASIKGEITGKLADYSITSKTSNGRNNLPEKTSGGSKTIEIDTSNNDIEINFVD